MSALTIPAEYQMSPEQLLQPEAVVTPELCGYVSDVLNAILENKDKIDLPVLPATARDALTLAFQPDPELLAIKKVIESDFLLASRLMRAANSGFYGGRGKVTSMRAAVSRLGVDALQELLMRAVAESHAFRSSQKSKRMSTLRNHSLLTGYIAKQICKDFGERNDSAFACGLFHDLGHVVAEQALGKARPDNVPPELETTIGDLVHTAAAQLMLQSWELPEEIVTVSRLHHGYGSPGEPNYCRSSNLIAVADRISYCAGVGEWPGDNEAAARQGLEDLGADADLLEPLIEWAKEAATKI